MDQELEIPAERQPTNKPTKPTNVLVISLQEYFHPPPKIQPSGLQRQLCSEQHILQRTHSRQPTPASNLQVGKSLTPLCSHEHRHVIKDKSLREREKKAFQQAVVAHSSNPSIWEAEASSSFPEEPPNKTSKSQSDQPSRLAGDREGHAGHSCLKEVGWVWDPIPEVPANLPCHLSAILPQVHSALVAEAQEYLS